MKYKILILGGSGEGFALDKALHNHPSAIAITSFAGRTSLPRKPLGPFRTGGFGGAEGLAAYIRNENITALIDATHPFAAAISRNAAKAAALTGRPLLHIRRPAWQKTCRDQWVEVKSTEEAASILTSEHSPTLLTTGRLELSSFLNRQDITFIARTIEPAKVNGSVRADEEAYPANFSFIYDKGPFTLENERALIKQYNIRAIVSKNSGGPAASAKLIAARDANLPIIMITRPPLPEPNPGTKLAATIEDALTWIDELLH